MKSRESRDCARQQAEEAWFLDHLDKSQWNQPEKALFAGILAFYDRAPQG